MFNEEKVDNINIASIKCVIWDLDNTIWKGVLSEGSVEVYSDAVRCIKHLSKMGIVQSVCSKNNYDVAKNKLVELGLWEYFVFVSIDWAPKGARIKAQINAMNLRPANVLFVDDEPIQRQEVIYYNDNIMVQSEKIVRVLLESKWPKTDVDRLEQYKLLEARTNAKKEVGDRIAFLRQSNITVKIYHNCRSKINRLYELYIRTNQLNFTKNRVSKKEFKKQIMSNTYDCGYITVKDKYGDYGIVGFYALKEGMLVDYLFSCRIIDMGVEQYVYKQLGCPAINIVYPVVSDKLLSNSVETWINDSDSLYQNSRVTLCIPHGVRSLLKGPCDLLRACSFIKKNKRLCKEVYYQTSDGKFMYAQTCFANIYTSTIVEKIRLESEMSRCPFGTIDYFVSSMLRKKYDIIFLSVLPIVKFGVYKKKGDDIFFQVASYQLDITKDENFPSIVAGTHGANGFDNTSEKMQYFSHNYEKIDYINNYFKEHLLSFVQKMKDTKIVFVLGNEEKYLPEDKRGASSDAIQRANNIIRELEKQQVVSIIDVNQFILSENDVIELGTHYTTPIYFRIAQEIVSHTTKIKEDKKLWK